MKKIVVYLSLACLLGYAFIRVAHSPNRQAKNSKPAIDSEFKPFALMELYTSEGCDNCPPAYKVVKTFLDYGKQSNQNIYLLDFHVDYFNKPWVDPYSSAANTKRQDSYARIFLGEGAFTPQMIVNGSQALLGSNPKKVDAAVTKALSTKPSAKIDITSAIAGKDGAVEVKFAVQNIPPDSMINIAVVQKIIVQKVPSGENAGKTLTHHNVVRYMLTTTAKSGMVKVYLPPKTNDASPAWSVIAFRQDLSSMKILAATQKDL